MCYFSRKKRLEGWGCRRTKGSELELVQICKTQSCLKSAAFSKSFRACTVYHSQRSDTSDTKEKENLNYSVPRRWEGHREGLCIAHSMLITGRQRDRDRQRDDGRQTGCGWHKSPACFTQPSRERYKCHECIIKIWKDRNLSSSQMYMCIKTLQCIPQIYTAKQC